MFTLKKIISAFIMPLPFGVLLGIIGLFFLFRNSYTKAKIFLSFSFIFIFLSAYNPIANTTLNHLESMYEAPKIVDKNIQYAHLLGGDFEFRAYGVLKIYNQNPNITIITSGYKGDEKIPEAIENKQRLIKLGIPADKIIALPNPNDTKSEAIALKKILQDKPFYLVTSASHMHRSISLFKNQGLNAIAYPSGYHEKTTNYVKFVKADEAFKINIAAHEYIGLLWSTLKGDI